MAHKNRRPGFFYLFARISIGLRMWSWVLSWGEMQGERVGGWWWGGRCFGRGIGKEGAASTGSGLPARRPPLWQVSLGASPSWNNFCGPGQDRRDFPAGLRDPGGAGARRVRGHTGAPGAHRIPGGTQGSRRCAQGAGASPCPLRPLRSQAPSPQGAPSCPALGPAGRAFQGGPRPRPPLPRRTSGNVVRAAPLRKFFTLHVSLTAGLGFLGKGGQAGGRRRPLARAGRSSGGSGNPPLPGIPPGPSSIAQSP